MADIAPQAGVFRDGFFGGPGAAGVTEVGSLSVTNEGRRRTFSAIATGLVPAASCTDLFCISTVVGTVLRLTRLSISGTAGTLVTLPVFLAKRVTLDTGGTLATGNALPVAATMDPLDTTASVAVLATYTAVPTINDTSPTFYRAGTVCFPVTTAGTANGNGGLTWEFGTRAGAKCPTLRATAHQLCLNLSTISVSSGVICIDVEWTETTSATA